MVIISLFPSKTLDDKNSLAFQFSEQFRAGVMRHHERQHRQLIDLLRCRDLFVELFQHAFADNHDFCAVLPRFGYVFHLFAADFRAHEFFLNLDLIVRPQILRQFPIRLIF